MNWKGSGRKHSVSLNEVLFRHFPERLENHDRMADELERICKVAVGALLRYWPAYALRKTTKNIQDNRFPGLDSNRAYPEYGTTPTPSVGCSHVRVRVRVYRLLFISILSSLKKREVYEIALLSVCVPFCTCPSVCVSFCVSPSVFVSSLII
jgi:hypothetical protein